MTDITFFILVLCLPAITSFPLLSQPVDGTACEWNVWDDTTEEKSVQKISIRCSEGQVIWRTPYGGLAITFLPPLRSEQYELCFVAESYFATIQLFLEGNQSLSRLNVLNGSKAKRNNGEVCLNATSDREIVIFAETDSGTSSAVLGKMVLDYDVRAIKQSSSSDDDDQLQECSPCNEEATVLAACTADYAVVGEIRSISEVHNSSAVDLNVLVSHIIRQRINIVKDSLDDPDDRNDRNVFRNHRSKGSRILPDKRPHYEKAKVRDSLWQTTGIQKDFGQRSDTSYNLSIKVPGKCQVRQGKGIFLFLGSIRLKKARLECAPRLEEFQRIWKTAVETGNNPCKLKLLE